VALTSNPEITDYSFTITSSDLLDGKLKRPSQVRVDKLYTLAQAIVVRKFGQVNDSVLEDISELVVKLMAKE
jgi:mRNA interferase MazF